MENYKIISRCRDDKLGGGVSILIHDTVNLVNQIVMPFNDSFECIAVRLLYKKKVFSISEVYRPPNSDDKLFISSLNDLMKEVRTDPLNFVCGDFNYDLLKDEAHSASRSYFSHMLDNEYIPYILKPTRVTHTSSTLIDKIYVKSRTLMSNLSYVLLDGISDHYPCLVSHSLFNKKPSKEKVCLWRRGR